AFIPYKKDKVKIFSIINRENIRRDIVIRVELMEKKKGQFRPYKIWYKYQGLQDFIEYKEFFKMLKCVKKVLIPKIFENELKNIMKMLNDFQIKYKIVEICRFCFNNDKLNVINYKNAYLYYNEFICKKCALKEIKNELKYINFSFSDQFLNNINKILDKFRNVNRILNIIKPGFIAAKDKEFTLYDIIEPHKNRTNIFAYKIDDLKIPTKLKQILKKENIEFLPVQNLAITNGLLEGQNLLIVAPTSAGKTLCGELAGVSRALNGGRMLYLAPLVALTNSTFEKFKKRYGKILNVAIRVGMSRINVKGEDLVIIDSRLDDADIICASYEAFDYLIRKGEFTKIDNIQTIIIDEIQTLGDKDRGVELDGLISRLRVIYAGAQIIGLSATIANTQEISKKLGLIPVIYNSRPVPVERHLVLCKSNVEKELNLTFLVKKEKELGASIIFTNSRHGTYQLSRMFMRHKLEIPAYHSGLSYYERKKIEEKIENGEIPGVVATYALGAGIDLPVSQVIFYSMKMGKDYLSQNMFLQMAGRAGRYKRHKLGKVVLLVELGLKTFNSDKTEDQIALSLLDGKEEMITIEAEPEEVEAQLLASIASGLDFNKIQIFYDKMISAEEEFHYLLKELNKKNMLSKKNGKYIITKLGRATAISFFTPDQSLEIIQQLKNGDSILDIALRLDLFTNIYLDDRLKENLSKLLKINLPSLFFTGMVFDEILNLEKIRGKIPDRILKIIIKWQSNFSCDHKDKPFCDCGLLKVNQTIIELRLSGLTPREISQQFKKKFSLVIYSGDIFKMIDDVIHRLRGIKMISQILGLENYGEFVEKLIKGLEKPNTNY
ncbi:MAG: DUF5814 domain-containing protein, partial [Candidatus Helarchaeota archaeon]